MLLIIRCLFIKLSEYYYFNTLFLLLQSLLQFAALQHNLTLGSYMVIFF